MKRSRLERDVRIAFAIRRAYLRAVDAGFILINRLAMKDGAFRQAFASAWGFAKSLMDPASRAIVERLEAEEQERLFQAGLAQWAGTRPAADEDDEDPTIAPAPKVTGGVH